MFVLFQVYMNISTYKVPEPVKGINCLNVNYTAIEKALYDALEWSFTEVEKSEQKN